MPRRQRRALARVAEWKSSLRFYPDPQIPDAGTALRPSGRVDYANVFASLEKALAIYGAGKDGNNPVTDKAKLVADLRRAVDAATNFCATRQVILPAIEQLDAGSLERL